MTSLLGDVRHQVSKVQDYIMATGRDPDGTFDISTFPGTVFEGGSKKNAAHDSKEDDFFIN